MKQSVSIIKGYWLPGEPAPAGVWCSKPAKQHDAEAALFVKGGSIA